VPTTSISWDFNAMLDLTFMTDQGQLRHDSRKLGRLAKEAPELKYELI